MSAARHVVLLISDTSVPLRDIARTLLAQDYRASLVLDEAAIDAGFEQVLGELGTVVRSQDAADVMRQIGQDPPSGVLPLSEAQLPLACAVAALADVPHHGAEVVTRLTDKAAQRAALRSAGLQRLRFCEVRPDQAFESVVGVVGLPFILKPTVGRGSRHARSVASAEDYAAAVRCARSSEVPLPAMIAEEVIAFDARAEIAGYVSVDGIWTTAGPVLLGVTGKLGLRWPFRETGQFFPSLLDAAERGEVVRLVESALDALGFRVGPFHVEVARTATGPEIIEVNGRFGGYVPELYGAALGIDVLDLAVRASMGEAVPPPVQDVRGVHFEYYHQPPTRATRLVRASRPTGRPRDRALRSYRRIVRDGALLPTDGSTVPLDLITGWSASHDALAADLERLRSRMWFEFEGSDGPFTVLATDL